MGRQSKGLLVALAILAMLCVKLPARQPEGDCTIRGFVQASTRPKQMPRVRLLTSNATRVLKEIWTDTAGRFWFRDLRPGNYMVEVSAPGFVTARQTVSLVTTMSSEVVVELNSEPDSQPRVYGGVIDARVPPHAWQEWEKAQEALGKEDADAARKHLEKAVKEYEGFAAAFRLLAQLDLDANKLDDAEHNIHVSQALEPRNADGYVLEGALFNRRQQPKEALKVLEQAAALTPTWRGQFELAKTRFELKAFAEALKAAQRAIELRSNGDFPEAHVLLGNILVSLRRYPDAAREYRTFLEMAPDSPSAAPAREALDKLKAAGIL